MSSTDAWDQPGERKPGVRGIALRILGIAAVVTIVVIAGRASILVDAAVFVGSAAIATAIYAWIVRSRNRVLARIRALAPGQLVFTFQSNGWFQNAIVQLQAHGTMDPDIPTDDSRPLARGPRWASASKEALTLWRGYSAEPYFAIPWRIVTNVFVEREARRGYGGRTSGRVYFPGICVVVDSGSTPVNLILRAPDANGFGNMIAADLASLIGAIDRLRAGDPGEKQTPIVVP